MTNRLQNKQSQAGFTLVELAIVMIIIGLLIGGVLKGQELISNAQLTSTIAKVKALDAAISTFRDKYNALPGDMGNPMTMLPNCTAAPCSQVGNGNGRIDGLALGTNPGATQEGAVAFVHMAAADLITGVRTDDPDTAFGTMLPSAPAGGGFWIGYTTDGTAAGLTTLRAGHYLVLNGVSGDVAGGTNGALAPSRAATIDRKLDDGQIATGAVQSAGTGCNAAAAGGSGYDEANDTGLCSVFLRVQG